MWFLQTWLQKIRKPKQQTIDASEGQKFVSQGGLQIQELPREEAYVEDVSIKKDCVRISLTRRRKNYLPYYSIPQEGLFINTSNNIPENIVKCAFLEIVRREKDRYELIAKQKDCNIGTDKKKKKKIVLPDYPLLSYN